MKQQKRIGVYAGAFNPVHAGHIAFALQALETSKLDAVYFLPERRPRHKPGVEHFGHRVAMLKRAARPHPKLGVMELVDVSFTVKRTLPELQKHFPGSQLVFLFGSDVVRNLPQWPEAETLLRAAELVVGTRAEDMQQLIERHIAAWPVQPKQLTVFKSYAADISSSQVRQALQRRKYVRGLLSSVARYSERHWLYISLA